MSQRASSVGELALRVLSQRRSGKVTRVFQSSAYLRSGTEYILLLWGRLRSPMTVNLPDSRGPRPVVEAGDLCTFAGGVIRTLSLEVDVDRARVYRSPLLTLRRAVPAEVSSIVKGARLLKALYDVSPAGLKLHEDGALTRFVGSVLDPYVAGSHDGLFKPESYFGLVGRGGGFTPAGDDFVAGFLATFNYFARCNRSRQVSIASKALLNRTVPESASILRYSSMGQVDEALGELIVGSSGGKGEDFRDALLRVARRGHTSGIDVSVGVLVCEAALSDSAGGGDALGACMKALLNR